MQKHGSDIREALSSSLPATVGIWIELDPAVLLDCRGEGLIRWLRNFISGVDTLPAVKTVVIPCSQEASPIIRKLFLAATRGPGEEELISRKLLVKEFLWQSSRFDWLKAWLQKKLARCETRLDHLRETVNAPGPLTATFRRLVSKPRTPRRVLETVAIGGEAIWLMALRRLFLTLRRVAFPVDDPFSRLAREASRAFPNATWVIANPAWRRGSELRGRKLVTIADLAYREFHFEGFSERELQSHHERVAKNASSADKIICFSSHVCSRHLAGVLPDRECQKVRVVRHAPMLPEPCSGNKEDSRQQLAVGLRRIFTSVRIHRHYCDFPFERMRYVLVSSKVRPYKNYQRLLEVYESLLRHRRRNLKLVVTGNLDGNQQLSRWICEKGLVFDVVQATNVDEELHSRLIRHAELVIIPTLFEGGMPFGFAEAVGLGTPCAFSRIPAFEESLTTEELAEPEVFDPCRTDAMEQAVLYVLDHRQEVLRRQRMVVERLRQRTWANVAEEYLEFGSRRMPREKVVRA